MRGLRILIPWKHISTCALSALWAQSWTLDLWGLLGLTIRSTVSLPSELCQTIPKTPLSRTLHGSLLINKQFTWDSSALDSKGTQQDTSDWPVGGFLRAVITTYILHPELSVCASCHQRGFQSKHGKPTPINTQDTTGTGSQNCGLGIFHSCKWSTSTWKEYEH